MGLPSMHMIRPILPQAVLVRYGLQVITDNQGPFLHLHMYRPPGDAAYLV